MKEQTSFKEFLIPLLLMCLGSILIGCSAVFVRVSDLGAMATGFYRMLFSLPFLALWMYWDKPKETSHYKLFKKGGLEIFLSGLFFALDLAFWNWSVNHTTIVNSTLLNNTAAFFIPLTTWLLFKETPTLRVIVAAVIGFVGCLFLVGESFSISMDNLAGDLVSLLSGLFVAFYMIALKQVRAHISTGFLMFWTSACCTVMMGIFAYFSGADLLLFTEKGFVSVLGQALLVQVLGQGLLTYSLAKVSASYAGIVLFLAPVTSAVLGMMLYNENLSQWGILGMALVMLSILAIGRKKEVE